MISSYSSGYKPQYSSEPLERKVTIKATRLAPLNANRKEERKNIKDGERYSYKFTIHKDNLNIFAKFQTKNASNQTDDLDMTLCYDSAEWGRYEFAQSGNPGSNESMGLEQLPAGEYELVINKTPQDFDVKIKLL